MLLLLSEYLFEEKIKQFLNMKLFLVKQVRYNYNFGDSVRDSVSVLCEC